MEAGAMLREIGEAHEKKYGFRGKFEGMTLITTREFLAQAEAVMLIILAGVAWIKQRILVPIEERPGRQRRKEFLRKAGDEAPPVCVIQLRRREGKAVDPAHINDDTKPIWTHRWLADGHWRNQPFGPGHRDRRLQWVDGYVKGPDDKPLIVRPKVFSVTR